MAFSQSLSILFTYPVHSDRLDIFTNFHTPVGQTVKDQKIIETTEIMIQMVTCGRGVRPQSKNMNHVLRPFLLLFTCQLDPPVSRRLIGFTVVPAEIHGFRSI